VKGFECRSIAEAVTVTVLAGITGSASGGMSIALAAMSDEFIAAAKAANLKSSIVSRPWRAVAWIRCLTMEP
jgi:H+/gluconate symporter-like permease